MKIFSTFSGIGGFEIGIQNAYRSSVRGSQGNQTQFDEEWEGLLSQEREGSDTSGGRFSQRSTNLSDQRPFCVGYSEIDKYAIKVYEKQFPGVKNYGDITKINAEELPDFDCLVGGFPCQAFSIAGKRKGFEDTRGTLFFDLARILRAKRPRLFVFENVKGLLSHDSGRTFKTIIATIDELGYDCQWQVLNSKDFGVPQNRERIIIVGHLRGTTRPQVFPIKNNDRETSAPQDDNTRIRTENRAGHGFANKYSGTIRAGASRSHNLVLKPVISKTIRTGGIGSPHGAKQNWDSYNIDGSIRRLTPLECERLQAFPDNWTMEGIDGPISNTQRYKMCGNAVTTNVIQAVFERIMDYDTYRTR